MFDADFQLKCYNDVNRLRSVAKRNSLDSEQVQDRLRQLMEEYGQKALETAQSFIKKGDVTVTQHFRAAVERLLCQD